jgi:hypothetical protein
VVFRKRGGTRGAPFEPRRWQIHPRWRSPWVATAFIGMLGAVLCLTVSLGPLVNLTGACSRCRRCSR